MLPTSHLWLHRLASQIPNHLDHTTSDTAHFATGDQRDHFAAFYFVKQIDIGRIDPHRRSRGIRVNIFQIGHIDSRPDGDIIQWCKQRSGDWARWLANA